MTILFLVGSIAILGTISLCVKLSLLGSLVKSFFVRPPEKSIAERLEEEVDDPAVLAACLEANRQREELERLAGSEYRKSLLEFKTYFDEGKGVLVENAYGVQAAMLGWTTIKTTDIETHVEKEIPQCQVKIVKVEAKDTLSSKWALPEEGKVVALDPNWPYWKLISLYGREKDT